MRVQRKTISVLLLSQREIDTLAGMIDEAKRGHTVHYAETQTGPNQFFGVSIDEAHDEANNPRNYGPKQPNKGTTERY